MNYFWKKWKIYKILENFLTTYYYGFKKIVKKGEKMVKKNDEF